MRKTSKRIPLKISFLFSKEDIKNIEKLVAETIGKKLIDDFKQVIS